MYDIATCYQVITSKMAQNAISNGLKFSFSEVSVLHADAQYASLFVQDSNNAVSNHLLSKEGVTQGDPLSMMLYAVAVLPLIHSLKAPGNWTQNWYTDDSCVADFPSYP